MSLSLLLQDTKEHPSLFHWCGALSQQDLELWLRDTGFLIPEDLQRLWLLLGGGDLFETETILSPKGNENLGDDLLAYRDVKQAQGLSGHLVPFHRGVFLSVADQVKGDIAVLNSKTLYEERRFATIEAWYRDGLREAFVDTYGLRPR